MQNHDSGPCKGGKRPQQGTEKAEEEGEKVMEHILSLSYGKDSLACLGAIEQLGWPLERIVHAEVWATDTIPADLPPMVEFKAKADKIIKERWGIEVKHVCAMNNGKKTTYDKVFYRRRKFSKNGNDVHRMYGWPFQKGAWCNSCLKVGILDKIGKNCVQYLGISADEPNRFHNLTETKKSPLVEAGWDESYTPCIVARKKDDDWAMQGIFHRTVAANDSNKFYFGDEMKPGPMEIWGG